MAERPVSLEVWRHDDGFWRWRYVRGRPDGSTELALLGNREFADAEAAGRAASTAFPGVPVRRDADLEVRDERAAHRSGCLRIAGFLVVVGIVVLGRRRRSAAVPRETGSGRTAA